MSLTNTTVHKYLNQAETYLLKILSKLENKTHN